MANEARISYTMVIEKGNAKLNVNESFSQDITNGKGPGPGLTLVTTAGVDIDLSEFTTAEWAEVRNISTTGIIDLGIWDGATFYPMLQIRPGQGYPICLSSLLTQEYGTGTGTSGGAINTLRAKARTVSANLVLLAMDA